VIRKVPITTLCQFIINSILLIILIKDMTQIFNKNLYEGKIVLISGGATGICYEIAKQFLLHSASVYIISRKI